MEQHPGREEVFPVHWSPLGARRDTGHRGDRSLRGQGASHAQQSLCPGQDPLSAGSLRQPQKLWACSRSGAHPFHFGDLLPKSCCTNAPEILTPGLGRASLHPEKKVHTPGHLPTATRARAFGSTAPPTHRTLTPSQPRSLTHPHSWTHNYTLTQAHVHPSAPTRHSPDYSCS